MTDKLCEIVHVEVTDETGVIAAMTIPAFTVPAEAFEARLKELTAEYVGRSHETKNLCSLGDFALYLLAKSSDDPREIEAE